MKNTLPALVFLFLVSCTSSLEKAAWRVAENSLTNRTELTGFLQHYRKTGENEKYEAACFLIANMPGKYSVSENGERKIYDVDVVKSDSLIQSVEYSFSLKKSCPFLQNYTFGQFCEYVLPYRIGNEPLEYYWKQDCFRRFGSIVNEAPAQAARRIASQIKIGVSPELYGIPQKSYTSLIRDGYGKCDDRATLLAMALRAAGIPAAFEFVPYWGSSNNGHSFCSVILPDHTTFALQTGGGQETTGLLHRKTPKIYRKVYGITRYNPNNEYDTDIPELFRSGDLTDVTGKHPVGFRNVGLEGKADEGPVYLSVFSPGGWIPVADSPSLNFRQVGTGDLPEGTEEAVDLGNGIVYLPCRYEDDNVLPLSNPIVVSLQGIRILRPDTLKKEQVTLERKFPLNKRIIDFARHMRYGIFEGANRPDFADAKVLFRIQDIPLSRMQKINITSAESYRYIRYRRSSGIFSLAELNVLSREGKALPFRPIACEAINRTITASQVFDSDPLTYLEINGGIDLWIGMDLGRSRPIGYIEFAPRNDDNAVAPGDTYELYYWNNRWLQAGSRKADDYRITFDEVPAGALLWLRDITRGHEERPFTYENDTQVWW